MFYWWWPTCDKSGWLRLYLRYLNWKKKNVMKFYCRFFFFFFWEGGISQNDDVITFSTALLSVFYFSQLFYMSVHVPSKANMPVSHNVPTLKLCLFVYQDLRRKHFFFHEHYCNFFIPHQILNDFPYDGFMRLFLQLNEHDSVIFIKKN